MPFKPINGFIENNCYFTNFNNEYLFCCAIKNCIKCFRINYTFEVIREFQISKEGTNFYLTIKTNNNYATFFFMNDFDNSKYVYEYYIYLPNCQNKNYEILNSLNENKLQGDEEKLNNLFIINTNKNKYYFEINGVPDEFGYFTLNNVRINNRILVDNDAYILDFIVTRNDKSTNSTITINYIFSVEEEEIYSKECKITLSFKVCYHSCQNCFKDINNSTKEEHNCIHCKGGFYPSPENLNNCYMIEEKK